MKNKVKLENILFYLENNDDCGLFHTNRLWMIWNDEIEKIIYSDDTLDILEEKVCRNILSK
jgi:hypothetical protein